MKFIMLLLTLFFILPALASADKITLQDGSKIIGHIISEDALKVFIETMYGKLSIKRVFIKSVEYENISVHEERAEQPKKTKKEKLTFDISAIFRQCY